MAKTFDELASRIMTIESRDRAALATRRNLAELVLAQARTISGKSQSELARALGIRQPSLSKLENQTDMQISTLKRVIEALGGELEIIARLPEGDFELSQFRPKLPEKRRRSTAGKRSLIPKAQRKPRGHTRAPAVA